MGILVVMILILSVMGIFQTIAIIANFYGGKYQILFRLLAVVSVILYGLVLLYSDDLFSSPEQFLLVLVSPAVMFIIYKIVSFIVFGSSSTNTR